MRTFMVYVDEYQHGKKVRDNHITCDVRGKDLDEATILKRLTNNIKTWQTACNKGYFKENHYTFVITSYEEIK